VMRITVLSGYFRQTGTDSLVLSTSAGLAGELNLPGEDDFRRIREGQLGGRFDRFSRPSRSVRFLRIAFSNRGPWLQQIRQ
jgi:hypothetical protein